MLSGGGVPKDFWMTLYIEKDGLKWYVSCGSVDYFIEKPEDFLVFVRDQSQYGINDRFWAFVNLYRALFLRYRRHCDHSKL